MRQSQGICIYIYIYRGVYESVWLPRVMCIIYNIQVTGYEDLEKTLQVCVIGMKK